MATRGGTISRLAPAKINLGLHVLRRRDDGFHDIETVMVAIAWYDRLIYTRHQDFAFFCSDPTLPTDEENLCVRAAQTLADLLDRTLGGQLLLEKTIPHGAGLGGGSSDAAATLRLLKDAWGAVVSNDDLREVAISLGSDVPFFLLNGSPAVARGRGERLQNLADYDLPFPIAVVMPPARVATAEAYELVTPRDTARPDIESLVRSNDLTRWRAELSNDFEAPILAHYPEIAKARAMLVRAGAAYAALSGSGAAVFGVFEREADAERATEEAASTGMTSWWGYAIGPSMRPRSGALS